MVDAEYYKDFLRSVFRRKKVIVAVDVLVGAGRQADLLRELGAEPVLAIAGTHGTGPTPDIDHVLLHSDGAPLMVENIRNFERALVALPDEALEAVDRADPHHDAIVIASMFTPPSSVAGRRVYGGRRPEWSALEDKVVIDDFFDAAGITRPPSRIIATGDLNERDVVVAGDAKEGFNGGADYVRWIRTDDDLAEAKRFFGARCDYVRVMPFLEGIPCSIHGAVIDGTAVALRPAEMLTLRRPTSRFLYAGVATYWDPPDNDRAYMREVARRAAVALRDRYDFRGAFTVDGVLTADGFRPTELNPRAGAATGAIAGPSGIPYNFLLKAVVEGEAFDYRASELEELIVRTGDAVRAGGTYASIPGEPWEQQTHELDDATITLGPSGMGRFVLYAPKPESVAIGPSFAPRAVDAFGYIDRTFGTDFGPLEPARDVRG